MHAQSKAKYRRLSIWFAINLVIFISCYLNYRLQLKHRYLYKTLSVGLCLSRAAAMVINFNLILVWIPMCKYTLTKLAVIAVGHNHRQKLRLHHLVSSARMPTLVSDQMANRLKSPPFYLNQVETIQETTKSDTSSSISHTLVEKLKAIANSATFRMKILMCNLKIKSVNSFLIAVDHSTSLHTISATTITLASVIHTVAHLWNVINFSNNFDPLLSNLNMAEYKGQNPLQLLVSVPGITGCFMILILILMSLSSISAIRNSSFDLFQIFHRLSVLFVIFLILHPSSHVLKEQSNVDRHPPDVCYDEMVNLRDEILSARANHSSLSPIAEAIISPSSASPSMSSSSSGAGKTDARQTNIRRSSTTSERHLSNQDDFLANGDNPSKLSSQNIRQKIEGKLSESLSETETSDLIEKRDITNHQENKRRVRIIISSDENQDDANIENTSKINRLGVLSQGIATQNQSSEAHHVCQDILPKFVAQSSICWYVLSVGLSCYLLDLILRRLRRNKNPIELLDVRSDAEGNMIELTLNNNHRRFAHWLPGQFVCLNCPQIATYEWHPFTISSMDNRTRQFTLHIKTGGDWTRKLRDELKLRQQQQVRRQPCSADRHSMSLFSRKHTYSIEHCCNLHFKGGPHGEFESKIDTGQMHAQSLTFSDKYHQSIRVASFDCYGQWPGQSTIQCDAVNNLAHENNGQKRKRTQSSDTVKIDLDTVQGADRLHSICLCRSFQGDQNFVDKSTKPKLDESQVIPKNSNSQLDLFIDGPFHSPFERLLEQQVSVCIANGVGWTAFSSVFQQITNNRHMKLGNIRDEWWAQWRDFVLTKPKRQNMEPIFDSKCTNVVAVPTSKPAVIDSEQKLLNETKLHLLIIVTTIEQLKPFYSMVMRYFERMELSDSIGREMRVYNPIKEITAHITRSAKYDSDVVEFCRQQHLDLQKGDDGSLVVSNTFTILFGKPNFQTYLSDFSNLYGSERKISIYCCGSYEVKRSVEKICQNLNKYSRSLDKFKPIYCYHEENF